MKKLLTILFSILLISQSYFITSAESEANNVEFMYKDKFDSVYKPDSNGGLIDYDEIYFHKDKNNDTDWVMIHADGIHDEGGFQFGIFGDIFFNIAMGYSYPFEFNIGIYDVAEDKFYDLIDAWNMDYDNLHEIFYETATSSYMKSKRNFCYDIIGDVDKDGALTIKDATEIQKHLTGMISYNFIDEFNVSDILLFSDRPLYEKYDEKYGININVIWISDYNSDGKLNIKDATAIQKKLAKIDCNV